MQIAFIRIRPGRHRPKNARVHEVMGADKLAQFNAMVATASKGFMLVAWRKSGLASPIRTSCRGRLR